MRKLILILCLIVSTVIPVSAMDFTAPPAPEGAQVFMPDETNSFGEGLWYVLKSAISKLQPSLTEAAGVCLSLFAIVLLVSVLQSVSDSVKKTAQLVCTLGIGILLLYSVEFLIRIQFLFHFIVLCFFFTILF